MVTEEQKEHLAIIGRYTQYDKEIEANTVDSGNGKTIWTELFTDEFIKAKDKDGKIFNKTLGFCSYLIHTANKEGGQIKIKRNFLNNIITKELGQQFTIPQGFTPKNKTEAELKRVAKLNSPRDKAMNKWRWTMREYFKDSQMTTCATSDYTRIVENNKKDKVEDEE